MSSIISAPSCCDDMPAIGTLKVDEARQKILAAIDPITASEKLTLRNALGRVMAEDIISPISVPGHTNSAMDGYAIAGDDLPQSSNRTYQVIGKSLAGAPFNGRCKAGQCIRIYGVGRHVCRLLLLAIMCPHVTSCALEPCALSCTLHHGRTSTNPPTPLT